MAADRPWYRSDLWVTLALMVLAAALYWSTLAQIHVGDTPFYVEGISMRQLSRAHALQWPLARAIYDLAATFDAQLSPWTGTALLGVLGGVVGAGTVHRLTTALIDDWRVALWATLVSMLSFGVWRQAITLEMHLLPAALSAGACWCMVRHLQRPDDWRWVVGTGLFQGLAAACHMIAGPLLVVWGLFFLRTGSVRTRLLRAAVYSAAAMGIAEVGWLLAIQTIMGHAEWTIFQGWAGTMGHTEQGSGQMDHSLSRTISLVWSRAMLNADPIDAIGRLAANVSLLVWSVTWLVLPLAVWRWRADVRTGSIALLAAMVGWMPLILWVEPQNMEYYTVLSMFTAAWMGWLLSRLVRAVPKPVGWVLLVVATGFVLAQGYQHQRKLSVYAESPVEVPVGIRLSGPGQPATLLDGWGNSMPYYGQLPAH